MNHHASQNIRVQHYRNSYQYSCPTPTTCLSSPLSPCAPIRLPLRNLSLLLCSHSPPTACWMTPILLPPRAPHSAFSSRRSHAARGHVDGQGSGGSEHRRPRWRRHCVGTAMTAATLHLDRGGNAAARGGSISTLADAASERQRWRSGFLHVSNPNLCSPCLFQWMVGYVPL
jgi:hypothetical protein